MTQQASTQLILNNRTIDLSEGAFRIANPLFWTVPTGGEGVYAVRLIDKNDNGTDIFIGGPEVQSLRSLAEAEVRRSGTTIKGFTESGLLTVGETLPTHWLVG